MFLVPLLGFFGWYCVALLPAFFSVVLLGLLLLVVLISIPEMKTLIRLLKCVISTRRHDLLKQDEGPTTQQGRA